MRLDKDNTLLILNYDKHGLLTNNSQHLFRDDFTMLITFTPAAEYINQEIEKQKKENPDQDAYLKMYIIARSGMHQGLAFSAWQGDGEIYYNVEWEWWEKVDDKEDIRKIKIDLLNEYKQSTALSIKVLKINGEYILDIKDNKNIHKTESKEFGEVIDYSYSLGWVGAANRLLLDDDRYPDTDAGMFTGDIEKLHIQKKPLDDTTTNEFFSNYTKFKKRKFDCKEDGIFVSTDFKEYTPHKIKDYSGNGLHLLKYVKHWV